MVAIAVIAWVLILFASIKILGANKQTNKYTN
jgi:hypothetical protein